MKTIILYDDTIVGHHLSYIKIYTRALVELGYKIWIICPNIKLISKWIDEEKIGDIGVVKCFNIDKSNLIDKDIPVVTTFLNALICWVQANKIISDISKKYHTKPLLVFFMWLDTFISVGLSHKVIDLFFHYNWSGIYFHPRHLRIKNRLSVSNILNTSSVLLSRNCVGVAILDGGIKNMLIEETNNKYVSRFPEVTIDNISTKLSKMTKSILIAAKSRSIIGTIGSLEKRKGVLELINISKKLKSEPLFFLFAGRISKYTYTKKELEIIYDYIDLRPTNCYFMLEHIKDDLLFNELVGVCDVLYLVYNNFPHSSGLITKACVNKIPIIVSEKYYMGEICKKYKLGFTVDEEDINETVNSLQKLVCEKRKYSKNFVTCCDKYILDNNYTYLKNEFSKLIALLK